MKILLTLLLICNVAHAQWSWLKNPCAYMRDDVTRFGTGDPFFEYILAVDNFPSEDQIRWTRLSISQFGGGTGTSSSLGLPQGTATGTVSGTPAPAGTNFFTAKRRGICTSSASAGSYAIFRSNDDIFQLNTIPGVGGFSAMFEFGISDYQTQGRSWAGFASVTPATSATPGNPGSFINCIVLGADDTASNFSIIHNDGSGNGTRVYLGPNFPGEYQSIRLV